MVTMTGDRGGSGMAGEGGMDDKDKEDDDDHAAAGSSLQASLAHADLADLAELKHRLVGVRRAKIECLRERTVLQSLARLVQEELKPPATTQWDDGPERQASTRLADAFAISGLIAGAGRIALAALETVLLTESLAALFFLRAHPATATTDHRERTSDPSLFRAIAAILAAEHDAHWQGDREDETPLPSRPNMPPSELSQPEHVPDWIATTDVESRPLSDHLLSRRTERIFQQLLATHRGGETRYNVLLILASMTMAYARPRAPRFGLSATLHLPIESTLAGVVLEIVHNRTTSRKIRLAALKVLAAFTDPVHERADQRVMTLLFSHRQLILDLLDQEDDLETVVYAAKVLSHLIIASEKALETAPANGSAFAEVRTVLTTPSLLKRPTINALVRIWKCYPDRQNARASSLSTFAYLLATSESSLAVAEACDAVRHLSSLLNSSLTKDWEETPNRTQERLLEGCLLALAGFALQSDAVRTELITASVLPTIAQSLSHPHSFRVRSAACQAARSFSRSTSILRKNLVDAGLTPPLLARLHDHSVEVKSKACMAICNFVLELSPMKKEILDKNLIATLAKHTRQSNPELRLNAIWALKNLAYNSERPVKETIVNELGWANLIALARDVSPLTVEQSLHLLRNICSQNNRDVQLVFAGVGTETLMDLLEEEMGSGHEAIVLQSIWIISNISAGDRVHKLTVLQRLNIMQGILSFTYHKNEEIRKACVWCVINLLWESAPESTLFLPPSPHGLDPDHGMHLGMDDDLDTDEEDRLAQTGDVKTGLGGLGASASGGRRSSRLSNQIITRLHDLGFYPRFKEMTEDESLDVRERVADAMEYLDTWRE